MARAKKIFLVSGIIASVATALSFLLSVYTLFFPQKVNDAASLLTGPELRSASGLIRAAFVSSQLRVYALAVVFVVVLIGFALAAAYYIGTAKAAEQVAAGRKVGRWLKYVLLAVPAALCIQLGIYLPRSIFQPTNEEELARQFLPAAWAVRSAIGGVFVSLGQLLLAVLAAALIFFLAVSLPRIMTKRRFERLVA